MADETVFLLKLDGDERRPLVSRALPDAPHDDNGWIGTGSIEPPSPPDQCWAWFRTSAVIRPNVDAYAVNKHGFGFKLVPEIDLQAKDADEQIRVAMILDKLSAGELPAVSLDEARARKLQIESEAPIERAQAEVALRNLGGALPFLSLCIRTTRRQEVTGNAYWEILRDDRGQPARATLLPETTMRLCRLDRERTPIERNERSSPISLRPVRERVYLRRYVQLQDGAEKVWFKEFGDPRIISSRTGIAYPSTEAFYAAERQEGGEPPALATEVLHFKPDLCDSGLTDYGEPRWLGTLPGIAGVRASEEANEQLLSDGGFPEGFIFVSGGKPAHDLGQQIKQQILERRGRRDAWRPMIVTAEGSAGTASGQGAQGSVPKIGWIPFRQMQSDGLFLEYKRTVARDVQQQFRLTDIMVGRSEESNKAQAEAARDMAEEQVFAIERAAFDAVINRLLDAWSVRYWRFQSNGPKTTDPPVVIEMIAQMCSAGFLTPHEARELAADALGTPLDRAWATWKTVPLEYAKIGHQPAPDPALVISAEELEERRRRPFAPLTPELAKQALTVDLFRQACGYPPHDDPEKGKLLLAEVAPEKPAPAPNAGGPPGAKPPSGKLEETVKGILDARRAVQLAQEMLQGEMLEKARAAMRGAGADVLELPAEEWAKLWEREPASE